MNLPNEQQVEDYLSRIGASGALGKSERRKKLLRHLILAEARGSGGQLKAYSIGLDIFEKREDFDPQTDSVVRVEVGRLRVAIAQFEKSAFADCPLIVEIPKGTYRPSFKWREAASAPPDHATGPAHSKGLRALWWVAIASIMVGLVSAGIFGFGQQDASDSKIIVQLNDLSGERGPETASILRQDLFANKAVTVLLPPPDGGTDPKAEFVLSGLTLVEATGTTVRIELVNVATNSLAWSQSLQIDNAKFEDELSRRLSSELRVRLLGATKELLEGRDPENLTPEQLFVMGTWVPGPSVNAISWQRERIRLMEIALRKDPEFGAAHSVISDKLSFLANVYGPSNTPEALEQAEIHAQRAMELAPLDANVVFNVAQSKFHRGMISESLDTMKRVIELDPNHGVARFFVMVIPYTCEIAPDDVIEQILAFDQALSVDDPIRWLTLTWLSGLRAYRGEYELALEAEQQAALVFEVPYSFMRHAMILHQLGRTAEAKRLLDRQKENWPDIDSAHFANVTVPRFCSEQPDAGPFIDPYEDLDTALKR